MLPRMCHKLIKENSEQSFFDGQTKHKDCITNYLIIIHSQTTTHKLLPGVCTALNIKIYLEDVQCEQQKITLTSM